MTLEQTVDAIKYDLHGCSLRWLDADELDIIKQYTIAAVDAEREACAKICDKMYEQGQVSIEEAERRGVSRNTQTGYAAKEIARLIRARATTSPADTERPPSGS